MDPSSVSPSSVDLVPKSHSFNLTQPARIVTNFDIPSATGSKPSPSDMPVRRSTRDIKRKKFDDELIGSTSSFSHASFVSPPAFTTTTTTVVSPAKSPTKKMRGAGVTVEKTQSPSLSSVLPAKSMSFSSGCVLTTAPKLTSPILAAAELTSETLKFADQQQYQDTAMLNTPVVATASSTLPAASDVPDATALTAVLPSTVAESATVTATPAQSSSGKKRGSTGTGGSSASRAKGKKTAPQLAAFDVADVRRISAAVMDVGRWLPVDDLALVTAVMQVNDLHAVYAGVTFSCKFTLEEIQTRWYSLLYDPMICRHSQEAMKQLTPDVVSSIQSNTLYSVEEEKLLTEIPSTTEPTLQLFGDLMNAHPNIFYFARTSQSLMNHWLEMRQFELLKDQNAAMPSGFQSFSDIEDNLDEDPLPSSLGDNFLDQEILLTENQLGRQVKKLETELSRWHVVVECVTGMPAPDFDPTTIAMLKGRMVRYLVKSKEVSIGRKVKGNDVDVDLSLEGPAFKISRRQAWIKLRASGDFYLMNEGQRITFVDGKPVAPGSKSKLNDGSVVEFDCIRLVFSINQQYIKALKSKSAAKVIT